MRSPRFTRFRTRLAAAIGFIALLGLFAVRLPFVSDGHPPAVATVSQAKAIRAQEQLRVQASGIDHGVLRTVPAADGPTPYAVIPSMPRVPDYRDYNPETVKVELEPGLPISFQRTSTYLDHGRRVWIGRNPAIPMAMFVASGSATEYHSIIDLAPGLYGVNIKAGKAEVLFNAAPIRCAADQLPRPTDTVLPTSITPPDNTGSAAAAMLDVDLSIFVDKTVVDQVGMDSVITKLTAEIAADNEILVNSQITAFHWVIADIVQTPPSYVFSGDMNTDLSLMSAKTTTEGTLGKFVTDTMKASGSDEAVLICPAGGGWAGLAWVVGRYAIVQYAQLAHYTMAHEMGHNFGSQHDRITQTAQTSDPTNYNYGFMVIGNAPFNQTFGDVMAYATMKAPCFANPNVTKTFTEPYNSYDNGRPLAMGVDVTQPYPCYAARTLNENAARMAAYGNVTPGIVTQPTGGATTAGTTATLNVRANGASAYQWKKNDTDIVGATSATLTFPNVSSLQNGTYACVVTFAGFQQITTSAKIFVSPLPTYNGNARLVNLSTRSEVMSGAGTQIAGLVTSGPGMKVLIRAAGPALIPLGVTSVLLNPKLTFNDIKGTTIATNDDWDSATIRPIASPLGAFDWPTGSNDAAMVQTLTGSLYTMTVEAPTGYSGTGLIEVYDASQSMTGPRLVNLSTRSWVGPTESSQIAGFVIGGTGMKTLLIRSAGPAITAQGVTGAIADPALTLYSGSTEIATNDNWTDEAGLAIKAAASEVGAFAFTDASKDAALLVTLPAGAYTAIVTPRATTLPGVGLIEVYEVK